jgi:hypothetical protein
MTWLVKKTFLSRRNCGYRRVSGRGVRDSAPDSIDGKTCGWESSIINYRYRLRVEGACWMGNLVCFVAFVRIPVSGYLPAIPPFHHFMIPLLKKLSADGKEAGRGVQVECCKTVGLIRG